MYIKVIIHNCLFVVKNCGFLTDFFRPSNFWKNMCLSNLQISEGNGMGDSEMPHAEGRSEGV